MTYSKTKIAVVDPQTGYNKAAKIYKTFHAGLASYDKGLFQRFLPRDLANKTILDIGSGDARMYSYFSNKGIEKYIGFDIAERLLQKSPGRVEKVIGDIESNRPFGDKSVDVLLCFFVLVHIRDIQHVFDEAKRVLKPNGNMIILHNEQRRSYVYNLPQETFKIQDFHRKPSDIKKYAEQSGFLVEDIPLEENRALIGTLYNVHT